jgi:uncharacterized lipoprotein YddW (UPF0748 family)
MKYGVKDGQKYSLLFILPFLFITAGCQQIITKPVKTGTTYLENCVYPDNVSARNAWAARGKSKEVILKKQKGIKAIQFPCSFSDYSSDRQHSWEKTVKMDLSRYTGIQLTIYCPDVTSISLFYLYLKSGSGWYYASFYPRQEGTWDSITILKSRMKITGIPSGFHTIERLRLTVYPCDSRNTEFYLAEISCLKDSSPIAIIRNESVYEKDPLKGVSVIQYTQNVSRTLSALGLTCNIYSDTNLSFQQLRSKKVLILPYNPNMSNSSIEAIGDFLLAGGKLISFYILHPELRDYCGIDAGSYVAQEYTGYFHTMRFNDEDMRGIPPVVFQASWNIIGPEPIPGRSKTFGTWYTIQGENTGLAAAVLSDNCIHFSHVLLQDDPYGKQKLLSALINHFLPALKETTGYTSGEKKETLYENLDTFLRGGYSSEFRGIWCHNAAGIPGFTWEETVKRLKKHYFTDLFPNMCTGGIAYYESSIIPRHASVKDKGDQIKTCLSACRNNGIKCHIWKICYKLGEEVPASFLTLMKKEKRLQVSSSGSVSEQWLCPSNPKNQQLEINSACEIVQRYNVDGIHLDYIRYPSSDYCFCEECRKRFEVSIGKTIHDWPGAVLSDNALSAAWEEFRCHNITEVVKQISEKVHAIRKGVLVSAAVFPNLLLDRKEVAQDWGLWCEKRYCDFVCPMNYTDSLLRFDVMTIHQQKWAHGIPCYPGIGISAWDTPYNGTLLFEQIKSSRNRSTGGFVIFQYDSELNKTFFLNNR